MNGTSEGFNGQEAIPFCNNYYFQEENETYKEREIDPSKIKEISVRITFKGDIIAERENTVVSEEGECIINLCGSITVKELSPQFMDDILANPVLFTVMDCTSQIKLEKDVKIEAKKESKKGTSRASVSVASATRSTNPTLNTNILGICSMDLGPIIKGQKIIKEKLVLELEKNVSGQNIVSWPNLPRLSVLASVGEEELIPHSLNKFNNIIDITVESVYNAPANIEEGTTFDATFLVPSFGNKLETLTFSNGIFSNAIDFECYKRWSTLPNVEGRGALTKLRVNLDASDIINHDNEIPDLERSLKEDGPRIHWNKWRRSVMVKSGSNFFFEKLIKNKVWPIEISMNSQPISQKPGKTDKRSKTAQLTFTEPGRYIAYLRLNSLLYPGANRVRVASRLYNYSPSDLTEKCGADFVSHGRSESTTKTKIIDKSKSPAKDDRKQEDKDLTGIPLVNENDNATFIIVEVVVWKPYAPKREPEYFCKNFQSYLAPRGEPTRKETNLNLARRNLIEIVMAASYAVNECYTKFALLNKTLNSNSSLSDTEDQFMKHLCRQEVFQKIKVSLEERIVDYVGEVYGNDWKKAEKFSDLVVNLVVEIRRITAKLTTLRKPLKVCQTEADDLQLSAEEAIEANDYRLAKRYLLQKLWSNKLNPDYWLDYALLLMTFGDHEEAVETIREALILDMGHQMGLLMYGLALAKMKKDLYLAELTFQVLLAKYPTFAEGWMIIHLFYSSIGNLEGAEFTLQTALNIDTELKEKTASYEKAVEDSELSSEESQGKYDNPAEGKYGIASFSNGWSRTDPLSWTISTDTKYSLYIRTAVLLLRLRSFEFAELAMTRESPSGNKENTIEYLYFIAVSHYLQGQFDEAISHLQFACERFGKNSYLLSLMGHCYYKLNNYENSIKCYEFVVESFNRPDDIHLIYIRMGIYYMKSNKYECAKKMFLSACKYSPSSETWLGLGVACYNLGELQNAETALIEANFLDSHCPVVWGYLTLVNIQLERYDVVKLCYAETKKKNLRDKKLMNQINAYMELNGIKE